MIDLIMLVVYCINPEMKAIEKHRETWNGKSDEWLFERLDGELKQKVEEIYRLLAENEELNKVNDTLNKYIANIAESMETNYEPEPEKFIGNKKYK